MPRTIGLSPKIIPYIAAGIAGVAVTVIGALNGDGVTLGVGLTALGLGGGGGLLGYTLPPGLVVDGRALAIDHPDLPSPIENAQSPPEKPARKVKS